MAATYEAKEIAKMLSQALQAEGVDKHLRAYGESELWLSAIRQLQSYSDAMPLNSTALGLTPQGAKKIAQALAKEAKALPSPARMPQDFFLVLAAKLLIEEGDYPAARAERRDKDRARLKDALGNDVGAINNAAKINGNKKPALVFCITQSPWHQPLLNEDGRLDSQKLNLFFQALGKGDRAKYEAALGEKFWEKDTFKSALPEPENAKSEGAETAGVMNVQTILGMVGLAGASLWALLSGEEKPAAKTDTNAPAETEKSFWAQPKKYLGIAGLLGLGAWAIYLYKQSTKTEISR